MFSLRTSQFVDRRLGESNKDISQDEKYSKRLRVVRKNHNKRASKYSLEGHADLTHFGKRIADMPKSELRQAYIGSGDERDEEPFSYDDLISKSKDYRAAARRQKMEAEAELEDLDGQFGSMWKSLDRRDMTRTDVPEDEDDMAFLARSFQMENIKKAVAGERQQTAAEVEEARMVIVRRSQADKDNAAKDNTYDAEEDDETQEEFDEPSAEESESTVCVPESTTLIPFIESLSATVASLDELETVYGEKLIALARECDSKTISEYFNANMNSFFHLSICSIIFPLDHVRHPIAVPALKSLEVMSGSESAALPELELLAKFLTEKFSPVFFKLAAKLISSCEEKVLALVSRVCSHFTREALDGVMKQYLPQIELEAGAFTPLKMHLFKPVEVLSLEPAYHEDGSTWSGDHKEIRAAKKLEQEHKKDKRLTAKEMRREAMAHETLFAMEKRKEQQKSEATRKRSLAAMDQAENNFRQMRTDNGPESTLKMKRNKKSRKGGNKV